MQQFGFRKTASSGPDQPQSCAHKSGLVTLVITLVAGQHLLQQSGNIDGGKVFREAFIKTIMGSGDSEVIKQNLEVKRVGRSRREG